MITAEHEQVKRELSRWHAVGKRPVFWVRDDDAIGLSEQLSRLHSIALRYDTSIGLAVIPGLLKPELATFLKSGSNKFYPMCHGWKHINHGKARYPNEFGDGRSYRAAYLDATYALRAFREQFPDVEAVFVPPFNGMTAAMVGALTNIGFWGLSAGPTPLERRIARVITRIGWIPGLSVAPNRSPPRIDAHVDLIDWRSGSARDAGVVSEMLVGQLRLRRKGFLAPHTPIGLLTHHRVHDEKIWRSLEDLIVLIKGTLGCEFIEVSHMFRRNSRERVNTPQST